MVEINMELWKLFIEIGNIGLLGIADLRPVVQLPRKTRAAATITSVTKRVCFMERSIA
jgi:hypothetical protein